MIVIQCDRRSPELFTSKNGVLTRVQLTVSQSNLVLHQAALVSLMDFANSLTSQLDEVKGAQMSPLPFDQDDGFSRGLHRKLSEILEEGTKPRKTTVKGLCVFSSTFSATYQ